MTNARYDEGSIRVLKGLEPVKERPGMYTRTGDPGHIIAEAIDNCVDEALAGHAKKIEVTLYADGSIGVADNGRGIPIDPHPKYKNKIRTPCRCKTTGCKFKYYHPKVQ